jgi:hypothetical protein
MPFERWQQRVAGMGRDFDRLFDVLYRQVGLAGGYQAVCQAVIGIRRLRIQLHIAPEGRDPEFVSWTRMATKSIG